MLVRPEGRTLRDLESLGIRRRPFRGFQCSSAPKDGRYTWPVDELQGNRLKFQCSSAPKDGRYIRLFGLLAAIGQVSMLVRPEGRTLRALYRMFPRVLCLGFNARPPRRTDATRGPLLPRGCLCVSMLVRPEGRTLRTLRLALQSLPWFQCSSAPKDGRYQSYRTDRVWRSEHLFQCSSAPKDGRYASDS